MHEVINILGGGISVRKHNMDVNEICKRAYTIGTNDAFLLAPANIGISADKNFPHDFLERLRGREVYLKKCAETWPGLTIFTGGGKQPFSDIPGVLNGSNTGLCAFNLAYQMRPKKIYLFGFDCSENGYWYENVNYRPNFPQSWIQEFVDAKALLDKANIEVFIIGESDLTNYKIISYE